MRTDAWLDDHPIGVIQLERSSDEREDLTHKSAAPGFIVAYANRHAAAVWGRSREELDGRPLPSLPFIEEGCTSSQAELPPVRRVRQGESAAMHLMALLGPAPGDASWYQVAASPAGITEKGGIVLTLTDVTCPVCEVARESSRIQSIMEAMREGVTLHGPDGAVEYSNPAAERILGLSSAELLGRTPLDPEWGLLDETGAALESSRAPAHRSRISGDSFRNFVMGVQRGDEGVVWLRVNTYPLQRASEGPWRVVTTFSDITAELEAARRLAETQQRYEALLRAVPGAVYRYEVRRDGSEHFDVMSDACEEVMGVPAQAVLEDGSKIWGRIHPDDQQQVAASSQSSLQTLQPWQAEFRVLAEDGASYRWVKGRSLPQRTERGTLWSGVAVDITETKELESELQSSRRREAMVDMASGIAHNFNNVLAVVIPSLEYVLARVDGQASESCRDALQASMGAAELVKRLLVLSRRDVTRKSQSPRDLVPLVAEAVKLCRGSFSREIVLQARLPSGSLPVLLSEEAIHQVVFNLCMNARDAVQGLESPRIELFLGLQQSSMMTSPDSRQHALLTVSDNGRGVPESVRSRLGEPFVSTKPRARGTGLGLATVYQLVRDAGGSVECDTSERGTRFSLRLPLAEYGPADSLGSKPPPRQQTRDTLVLVEDEALVRRALVRAVERLALDVVEVERGDEALPTLRRLASNRGRVLRAVLLDLGLPGMSGDEVLPLIHREFPHLPVIVLSGHVVDSSMPGATAVLSKPIGADELCNHLERASLGHGDEQHPKGEGSGSESPQSR